MKTDILFEKKENKLITPAFLHKKQVLKLYISQKITQYLDSQMTV